MKEKNSGKKKRGFLRRALPFLAAMAVGGAAGFLGMELLFDSMGVALLGLASLAVSVYVHIIIHEGGHLVCGLVSGYRFVSFRIGSTIWAKRGQTIVRGKFRIAGTGGQCLLDPPEKKEDGSFPCLWYNLGGGLFNLLFSAAAVLPVALGAAESAAAKSVLIPFAVIGVYLGLVNLIPLKVDGIANDGYNIKTFKKDRQSADAFWAQMRINKLQQADGLRLGEISPEHFDTAFGEEEGNPLTDTIRMFWFQRLLDGKQFEEAAAYGRALLGSPGMLEIHKMLLKSELVYLECIGRCRGQEIQQFYDSKLEKKLKSGTGYPMTYRMLYACALLYKKDDAMAEKALTAFEKVLKTYPAEGELRTERELIKEIEKAKAARADEAGRPENAAQPEDAAPRGIAAEDEGGIM